MASSFKQIAWLAVFVLTLCCLALRVVLAFTSGGGPWSVLHVLMIFLLLYNLFMLEGLQVSAIQIKTSDKDGILDFIEHNVPDRRKKVILNISSKFISSFNDFVVGRQIFTMITVVSMATFFASLPASPSSPVIEFLDGIRAGLGTSIFDFSTNTYVVFLISTLFPCWMAQLLPQFMADNRGVEFAQLFGAKAVVLTSLQIAKIGAGRPGFTALELIQRLNHFTGEERIAPGDLALHDRLVSYFGVSIIERSIVIQAAETETRIKDTSHLAYSGGSHSNVRHMVRLRAEDSSDVKVTGWTYDFPDDIRHDEPKTKSILVSVDQLVEGQVSAEGADTAPDDELIQLAPLEYETILAFEAALEVALPRSDVVTDDVTVSVEYTGRAPMLDELEVDTHFVDVSKPTKRLSVEIITSGDLFCRKPEVSFQFSDEMMVLGNGAPLRRSDFKIGKNERGWSVVADYPPLGSRMKVEFDARKAAKMDTAA